MSECRICLNSSDSEDLIAPCRCAGSIRFVHEDCLMNWLREKYQRTFKHLISKSKAGKTGLKCELCKSEFHGKLKYLGFRTIIKRIARSKASICILLNIPVIVCLFYKFSALLRHLFLASKIIFSKNVCGFKKMNWELLSKVITKLMVAIYPISAFAAITPIVVNSTIVLLRSLVLECMEFKIENFYN